MKIVAVLCLLALGAAGAGGISLEKVQTGGVVSFQHASVTSEVICHPDGVHVLSSSRDQCVRLWEIKSGKLVRRFTAPAGGDMWGIRFLKEGTEFLAASSSERVFRFEVASGKLLQEYVHDDDVYRIALHPDGKRFVSVGGEKTAILWEIETGKKIQTFAGHTGDLYTALITADGKQLITGSNDKTVRKWDLESGKCLETLKGKRPFGSVYTLALSPDGQRFAMITYDHYVRVYQCANFEKVWEVKLKQEGQVVAWSPDGGLVGATSEDGHLYVLDGKDGAQRQKIEVAGRSHTPIAFSNDGTVLISGGDQILHLHEVASGRRIEPGMGLPDEAGRFSHLLVGPGGKTTYLAFGAKLVVQKGDDEEADRSLVESHLITAMALSPDASLLAVGNQQGGIVVRKTSDLSEVCRIAAGQQVYVLAFHPDGQRLAAGGARGMAGMWAIPTGDKIRTFQGHSDELVAMTFSGDGEQLVTAADDGTARQWSLVDGRQLASFVLAGEARPSSLITLDAGRSLMVGIDEREVYGRILEKLEERQISDVARVEELLKQLGHPDYQERESAMKELAEYGREVIPYLEAVRTEDPEVKARLSGVRDVMQGRLSEGGLDEIGKLESFLGDLAADPLGEFWVGRVGSEGAASLVVGVIDHEAKAIKVLETIDNLHGPRELTFSPDGSHVGTVNADGTYSLYRVKRD